MPSLSINTIVLETIYSVFSALICVILLKQSTLYLLIFAQLFFVTGNVFIRNYKSKLLPNL
jgi:hypothetical protein